MPRRRQHGAACGEHYSRGWLKHIVDRFTEEAITAASTPLQEPGALHRHADRLWELAVKLAGSPGSLSFEAKCDQLALDFLSTLPGVCHEIYSHNATTRV